MLSKAYPENPHPLGLGSVKAIPEWVNDPAKLIEMVRLARSGQSQDIKREIAGLRAAIQRMKPAEPPPFVTDVAIEPVVTAVTKVIPSEVTEEEPKVDELQLLTQLASLFQLGEIRKKLGKEEFEGKLDPRTLDATGTLQWLDFLRDLPHKPWITAYFINDGPNTVEIGINHPELKRHSIRIDETLTIDQTHADERIRRLFYQCASGETASVRVAGQY